MKLLRLFFFATVMMIAGVNAHATDIKKDYYAKAIATATGAGKVYVNIEDKEAEGAVYDATSECGQTAKDENPPTLNFYIFAKPDNGNKVVGVFSNEECTEKVTDTPEPNGSYKVGIEVSSTDSKDPTTGNYYVKFEEIKETYNSKISVAAVGEGNVAVNTEDGQEYIYAKNALAENLANAYQEHRYYLNAQSTDANVYRFVAWYKDAECTEQLSEQTKYTYTVTAESTDQTNPTEFNVYAKFEAIPYYYSTLTAYAAGTGLGEVSVRKNNMDAKEYGVEKQASISTKDTGVHTYYLDAQTDDDDTYFSGWYEDAEFTELISTASSYTYKVTSESKSESEPAVFSVYANFKKRNLYQITNSDFELWNSAENEPAPGWNSFPSAVGSQASLGKGMSPNPSRVEGRTGYGVRIYSKFAGIGTFGANANGNLTTGVVNMGSMTPTDASNHNFTNTTSKGHYMIIAGQPDGAELWTKYKMGNGDTHTGLATFIIHDEVNYRDPEVDSQAGNRIAIAKVVIPEAEDWNYVFEKFDYEDNWSVEDAASTTKYILVNITTNPTPGGSIDDELIIDDVKLIYKSELAQATYNGEDVVFTDNCATVSGEYDESKLVLTSNGRAATIEKEYNNATSELTIVVKGQDISEDESNFHNYVITFASATGITNINSAVVADKTMFNLAGQRVNTNAKGVVLMKGKKLFLK